MGKIGAWAIGPGCPSAEVNQSLKAPMDITLMPISIVTQINLQNLLIFKRI
ncbi:MAG: hypothetical protein HC827_22125 [Cyanobacteria bacterium RM1_2_2]|nr:hypothetical protein [Cyanobacteria bacterium RM1_2_2]